MPRPDASASRRKRSLPPEPVPPTFTSNRRSCGWPVTNGQFGPEASFALPLPEIDPLASTANRSEVRQSVVHVPPLRKPRDVRLTITPCQRWAEGFPPDRTGAGEPPSAPPTPGASRASECAAANAPMPAAAIIAKRVPPISARRRTGAPTASRRAAVDVVAHDEVAERLVLHQEDAARRQPCEPLHEPDQPRGVLQHEHVQRHARPREADGLRERQADRLRDGRPGELRVLPDEMRGRLPVGDHDDLPCGSR